MPPVNRAAFLARVTAVPAALGAMTTSAAETDASEGARVAGAGVAPYGKASPFESAVVRAPQDAVDLAFTPLGRQTGIITPSGLCFVRNHAGVPKIDPKRHRLLIDGLVGKPLVLRLDEIMRFPSVSQMRFIECAGNTSNEWQLAKADNVQASHGLVSCCEWTGVPLRTILEEVRPSAEVRWAIAEGADAAAYDRSIPMDKLLDDALLVYGQNGEMLRPEQGYPLRLLLPGFEGSTNVKWLRRLHLTREPVYSREETAQYTELLPGGRARAFDFVMDAKSVITSPSAGDRLPGPGYWEIRGFAWSGRGRIAGVDVSLDGGKTWSQAKLADPVLPKCFTRFTHDFDWSGRPALILSRAMDETGYVQPTHERLVRARGYFAEYHNNAIQPWQIAASGDVSDARA